MAAVTRVDVAFVSPPGMEGIDRGFATEAIVRGDPVVISGAAPSRLYDCSVSKATGNEAHGIAIKDKQTGGLCEFAFFGEIDGFSGLTPGAPLSVVAGNLDTDPPVITGTTATGGASSHQPYAQLRAVNASRIRVNLV